MITFTPLLVPINAVASILSTYYASLFGRLSQRTAVLSLNAINWVKFPKAIFHTPWSRVSSELALFSASQKLQCRSCIIFIRRVRKIAKNDYEFRHVCLSVRPHETTPPPLEEFL